MHDIIIYNGRYSLCTYICTCTRLPYRGLASNIQMILQNVFAIVRLPNLNDPATQTTQTLTCLMFNESVREWFYVHVSNMQICMTYLHMS